MKVNRVQHLRLMGLLIFIVIVLDQLAKILILRSLTPGQAISIVPGLFNLVLTFNKGSAFGLFTDLPDLVRIIVLTLAMLIALSVLLYLLFHDYYDSWIGQSAIALILGGALGNNIDRFRFGKVVDFLDFYYSSYHWPAFNVADSVICIGVVVLLLLKPSSKRS